MIGDLLPKYIRKWLWKNAFNFPNVIGFSEDWSIRQSGGQWRFPPIFVPVIRFYVIKKIPIQNLKPKEIIPHWLKVRHWLRKHAFLTDIVEIKEQFATPPIPQGETDKTKNFRPVELGVSVGNEKITAGSLGMLYERTRTELQLNIVGLARAYGSYLYTYDNKTVTDIVAGSNAHVLTDGDPSKSVEEIIYKNILQRGNYHGGKVPDDVVGQYLWHQQIHPVEIPSECPVGGLVGWILNGIAYVLKRKTRFRTYQNLVNTIDFAIYKPTVEHILKVADDSIDPTKEPFFGHLYAGSDASGIICSVPEILKASPDLKPLSPWCEVQVGDRVKGCSFWCNFETDVIDVNAVINVNYGTFMALMTKAIIVTNDGTIKGGWSGSGWHKV